MINNKDPNRVSPFSSMWSIMTGQDPAEVQGQLDRKAARIERHQRWRDFNQMLVDLLITIVLIGGGVTWIFLVLWLIVVVML